MKKLYHCIIVDDEPTAREILMNYIEKIDSLKLIAECKNAIEAFTVLNSEPVDLIFLDINMPEITGLSFAKSLKKNQKVIFTTAYREYAVDGFDLQAVDYILKPISLERFVQAINKFLGLQIPLQNDQEVPSDDTSDFIFVRSDRKMVKIDFNSIHYIESLNDYIKIYTETGTIVTRETISNIEAKLPANKFLRIHRSYIVSLQNIVSYTNEFVEVTNKALPISRSYRKQVIDYLSSI
ncbi:MAG: response regulator transcription factor [Flavobacteriaceae bacterium]|nr:response regulator transcription factor [Flavobacteriaceae bacterium]